MTNQSKTNYILRLDHQFLFEQFGKKWLMYLPGFEGLYAISDDCCICALDRVCLATDGRRINYSAKLLKPYRSKNRNHNALGDWCYKAVSKNYVYLNNEGYVIFTKLMLSSIISTGTKEKIKFEFPFKYADKLWVGYLQENNGTILENYLVSDDCFVLSTIAYTDTDFQTKYKIRKWSLDNGYEHMTVSFINSDKTVIQKSIYRSTVLKQVSKILEGMPND